MKKLDKNNMSRLRDRYGMLIVLIAMVIFFTIANPNFFTLTIWSRILVTQVIVSCVALGILFTMVIGEFDISVGYMVGFGTMLGAYVSKFEIGLWAVLLAIFSAVLIFGLVKGILIVYFKISSGIATLGMGTVMYAFTLMMSNGQVLTAGIPKEIINLAQGRLFTITYPVYIVAFLGILVVFLLDHTPFGKWMYAIGDNERVAYLSGIKTHKLRIAAFVISSVFCALASIFLLGQAASASSSRGPEYFMSAYATVYLSVTAFSPGRFNAKGVMLSLILLGVGFKGLSMMGTPYWFENIFYSIVLVGAILLSRKELRTT